MSVFKTAYHTTFGNGFVTKRIVDAIQVAFVQGYLRSTDDARTFVVEGSDSMEEAIPGFAHPIEVINPKTKEANIVVDVRAFGKWDNSKGTFQVRNSIEDTVARVRGHLNRIWITENPSILRDISSLPMSVFSSWISESLGKRYALDPRQQLNLAILAAVYYSSLFHDDATLDEREQMRLVSSISRNLRASAQDVMQITDKVSVVPNLHAFCSEAREVVGSVRLIELNPGLMYAIMGGTWYGGNNPKEQVAVALEHPPTWIALLSAAITERTFKDSIIAKIAERGSNREPAKLFLAAVARIFKVNH